jgi:hypothetical protein
LLRPLLAAIPMALFINWLDQYLVIDDLWQLALPAALASGVYVVSFYCLSLTSAERAMCHSGVRGFFTRRV